MKRLLFILIFIANVSFANEIAFYKLENYTQYKDTFISLKNKINPLIINEKHPASNFGFKKYSYCDTILFWGNSQKIENLNIIQTAINQNIIVKIDNLEINKKGCKRNFNYNNIINIFNHYENQERNYEKENSTGT